jgi:hypothetical protein
MSYSSFATDILQLPASASQPYPSSASPPFADPLSSESVDIVSGWNAGAVNRVLLFIYCLNREAARRRRNEHVFTIVRLFSCLLSSSSQSIKLVPKFSACLQKDILKKRVDSNQYGPFY